MSVELSRFAAVAVQAEAVKALSLSARRALADRVEAAERWGDLSVADRELLLSGWVEMRPLEDAPFPFPSPPTK